MAGLPNVLVWESRCDVVSSKVHKDIVDESLANQSRVFQSVSLEVSFGRNPGICYVGCLSR